MGTFHSIFCAVYVLLHFCMPFEAIRPRRQDASHIHNYNAVVIGEGVHVSLAQGELKVFHHRGTGITTVINTFLGVPYGDPPVGDRRFAAPEPYRKWTGTLDTYEFRPRCLQSVGGANNSESEDCLYLNIYSPSVARKNPVMVWFHGGAFKSGSANDFDVSSLAAHGAVVVTVNFRLGLLGLLSTGDDVMPGNYAMLDQVLALKWIKKNIKYFGGDPEQVTIFGESSGAASVALHVLSPLSKGLFHKAIMQSGSSLSPWAVERPATQVKIENFTRQVGERVGCPDVSDSVALLGCLRNVSTDNLLEAGETLSKELNIDILVTPRVETTFGFLPDFPERLLENGTFNDVSTLRGFNSGEFSSYIQDPENDGVSRTEFQQTYRQLFGLYDFEPDARKYIDNFVGNDYLGLLINKINLRESLVHAISDTYFALPTLVELDKTVVYGNSSSNHFLYQLSYRVRSPTNPQSAVPTWQGILHGEINSFVFADPSKASYEQDDSGDKATRERVQTMWTNFAKFGNPVATPVEEFGAPIKWNEYTLANQELLGIDLPSRMTSFPRAAYKGDYDDVLDVLRREKSAGDN